MEYLIAIISCIGATMKPIKDLKKETSKPDKIWDIVQILSLLTICALICFGYCNKDISKKNKIHNCNRDIREACIEIYRTIYGYNRVLKQNGHEKAYEIAVILFKSNGDQLERSRYDYREFIDSVRLYSIDDALKSLKNYPWEIINSPKRKWYLYKNICKIDSSFKKWEYGSIISYDSLLYTKPQEYFDIDERMKIK